VRRLLLQLLKFVMAAASCTAYTRRHRSIT
jgi:hypothetical protein